MRKVSGNVKLRIMELAEHLACHGSHIREPRIKKKITFAKNI